MMEANKKRLKYVDIAKGLGMMMIVWMHVWGNNFFEFTPPHLLNSYIRGIYVPLFFVLSGYLIRLDNLNIQKAISKKAKSLLRPFGVVYMFSFAVSVLLAALGIGVKHEFEWSNFLNPLFSKTFFNGPLWFLLALFWAFALFFLAAKASRGKLQLLSLLTIFIGGVGFYLSHTSIVLPLFMGQGMVACPMLMIGYLIKSYIIRFLISSKSLSLATLIVGALVYAFAGTELCMQTNTYDGYFLQMLLGVFGGSMAFICFSLLLEKVLPFAEYCGKYSLIVLCFHNFFLIPCTKVTGKFMHDSTLWALVNFVVVYLCFLLVIPLVKRYTPSLFNVKK